jgi:hypothetical protein
MDRDDEYRRNAAKAQQSSRRARTDNERANWLRLAEGWLGLLRKCPETDKEALDIKTAAQKTGRTILHPMDTEVDTRGRLKLITKLCNRDRPSFATLSDLKPTSLRRASTSAFDPTTATQKVDFDHPGLSFPR